MLTIKLDEDGNAVSVSIDNLPAKADLADKPDDGLDPSEKPDPIDDDFTQPEQPASDDRFAPDDAFDPDDKPVSDDRFAPQDRTPLPVSPWPTAARRSMRPAAMALAAK